MLKLLVIALLAFAAEDAAGQSAHEAAVESGAPEATQAEADFIEGRDPDTPADGEVEQELPDDVPFLGDFNLTLVLLWAALLGIPLIATVGLFAVGGDREKE